jgi:hypothetical protein
MTKHAQHAEGIVSPGLFSTPPLANGPIFEALALSGKACAKACFAWQEEVMRFASDRLKKDSEFGRSMSTCQNWTDLAKLQQQWAAVAAQDYVAEANRLAQLASEVTQDGIAAWQRNGKSPAL